MMWGGELVLRDGEAGRPGDLGGLVGHARGLRRAGLRLAAGPGAGHRRPPDRGRLGRSTSAGGVHAATVGLKAPFDPANERIRS